VAFTMLTGRLPFSGETLGDLLLQICSEPLPSLRAAAPALPPAMEDWFQRACARQPEDRYRTAQAFIEALRVAAGISRHSDSVAERNLSLPAVASSVTHPDAAASDPALPLTSTTTGTTMASDSARNRPTPWGRGVAAGTCV